MRFAMFYPDDTLYDDGTDVEVVWKVPRVWHEAPRDGLQVVVVNGQPDITLREKDIYCPMMNGEIMSTDDLGPIMRTAGLAKYGLYLPRVEYDAVNQRVKEYRRGRTR